MKMSDILRKIKEVLGYYVAASLVVVMIFFFTLDASKEIRSIFSSQTLIDSYAMTGILT